MRVLIMSRSKTDKINELKNLPNTLQPTKPQIINWFNVFQNNHPLILELACGQGDYTLALAKINHDKNFIGIDIKGARLWHGAQVAQQDGISNATFLRIDINILDKYFFQNTVTEIWITFPDPFPKKKQIKHRLTSPHFLNIYQKILKPDGIIHLKTDDISLFNYSVEAAMQKNWHIQEIINNIYNFTPQITKNKNFSKHIIDIQTAYEKKHLQSGRQIHYCKLQNNK